MGKRLIVEPTQCLIDENISILVEDLNRYEIVEISAEMIDNVGQYWSSAVMVQANLYGEVNLTKSTPILGTYSHPCQMGLFWSMKKDPSRDRGTKTPLAPLKTIISLKRSGAVEEVVTVTRHLVHPALVKDNIDTDNLVGSFYHHGDHRPRPTILVLGGSEGGKREGQAALLAAKGFNALALAYFGVDGLPKQLVNIPLEYLRNAIQWLYEKPCVDVNRLGILGTSKGGELALLLASHDPKIKAVVSYVPSSVVHKGLGEAADGELSSSWSLMGQPMPFAYQSKKVRELIQKQQDQKISYHSISYREWYKVHADAAADEAVIPVEKIRGPVLVISGGNDQLWPSDYFGQQIADRLKKFKYPYGYRHLCYKDAGHAIGYPGMPTTESTSIKFGDFSLVTGGTPYENYKAQNDSWNKVITFFKQSL